MCVAGVLKGRESRDVMSSSRSLRFFLEAEMRSSTSAVGRDRFGHRRCDCLLKLSKGRETGVALKVKTVESGSANGERILMFDEESP